MNFTLDIYIFLTIMIIVFTLSLSYIPHSPLERTHRRADDPDGYGQRRMLNRSYLQRRSSTIHVDGRIYRLGMRIMF